MKKSIDYCMGMKTGKENISSYFVSCRAICLWFPSCVPDSFISTKVTTIFYGQASIQSMFQTHLLVSKWNLSLPVWHFLLMCHPQLRFKKAKTQLFNLHHNSKLLINNLSFGAALLFGMLPVSLIFWTLRGFCLSFAYVFTFRRYSLNNNKKKQH